MDFHTYQRNNMGKWFDKYKDVFFKKYTVPELKKSVEQYLDGSGTLDIITRHYFDELIHKCCNGKGISRYPGSDTPYDAIHSDDFINHIFRYMYKHNDNVFIGVDSIKTVDDEIDEKWISQIRTYFRFQHPRKVAQFPVKNVKKVIMALYPDHDWFDEPLNYHDASCGFGMRLTGSVLNNCNYFGTDPNKELYVKLNELYSFLRKYFNCGDADIRCIGSEEFVPEWENKMDLSFTSPPYFNLEVYSDDGCKSSKNYDNYHLWIDEFTKPTISNTIRYLKCGGYLCINIKNIPRHKLYDDYRKIISSHKNMQECKPLDLDMTNVRTYNVFNTTTNEKLFERDGYMEKIMVFKKNE